MHQPPPFPPPPSLSGGSLPIDLGHSLAVVCAEFYFTVGQSGQVS